MAENKYQGENPGINGLPIGGIDIGAGDDSNELSTVIRCFQVSSDGDVRVVLLDGTDVVLPACKAGVQYWYAVKQVMATNTSATGIKGFY